MTTFADMRKFTSVKDFSADTVKDLIGDYCVRGKAIDLNTVDPLALLNRLDWIVNRVGRVLDVSGKLDPATTSFKLDRDSDNILHVRIVDADGNALYVIDLGEKGHVGKGEFEYIVRDAQGKEIVRDGRWKAVATYFAPVKEAPVKKAAAPKKPTKTPAKPKKAKAEKKVKAVKNPVPVQPADEAATAEIEAFLNDETPPEALG